MASLKNKKLSPDTINGELAQMLLGYYILPFFLSI